MNNNINVVMVMFAGAAFLIILWVLYVLTGYDWYWFVLAMGTVSLVF